MIHSYDVDVLKDRLVQLGVQVLKVDTSNETPRICAMIAEENRQQVSQLLTQCGWYDIQPNESISMIVPKFGKDAQELVYNTHNGILYHTTRLSNCDRIYDQGLVSRSGNKIDYSQDLFHFLFSPNECVDLAYSLSMETKDHPLEFALYKIDLNKIKRDTIKPKFFFDPQYPQSVVTLDNVPSYCLTRIRDFELIDE
ncbi:MAG: hypothetical protein KBT04_04770 [Bacteroidales bacterium]|nr:hypothetical protein [Candidatus Colimorpha onthohippi]